jgi:hypothetical protein
LVYDFYSVCNPIHFIVHSPAERPDPRPQEPTASTSHVPQQNSELSLCKEPEQEVNSATAAGVPTQNSDILVNPLEELSNPKPLQDHQGGPSTSAETTETAEILKSDQPQLEEGTPRRASDVLKELNIFNSLRNYQNGLQSKSIKFNTSEAEKLLQIIACVVSQSDKEVRAVVKRLGKKQSVQAEKKAIEDADALLSSNHDIWALLIARARNLFYRERGARQVEKYGNSTALMLMFMDSSEDPSARGLEPESNASLEIATSSNTGCDPRADAERGPEPGGDAFIPIQTLSGISEDAVAGEKRKHQEIAGEASIKSEASGGGEELKKMKISELAS